MTGRDVGQGPEVRSLSFSDAEVRMGTGTGDGPLFRGYASVFGTPYRVVDSYGPYTETVARSAFDATLKSSPDVVFLLGHEGLPLARTKSGTLTLRTDAKGLLAEARLDPANPRVAEVRSMIDRGDLDSMSFTFKDELPTWNSAQDQRTLTRVAIDHGDVSIVNFPANAATAGSVSLRSLAAYAFETRAKYSSSQLQAMLKAGKAFPNANGDPSFPIGDRADLVAAVKAVGRAGADHDKVGKFIAGRAKVMGLSSLIPSSWAADGSLKQSNSAGRLGEHRATIFAGCACCPPCPGGGCDGSCCPDCDALLLAQLSGVINASVSSSSGDNPNADESLGLRDYSLEARLLILAAAGRGQRRPPLTKSEKAQRARAESERILARRKAELKGNR